MRAEQKNKLRTAIVCLVFLTILYGCARAQTYESFAMDTVIRQSAYGANTDDIADNNAEIARIEAAMSKTLPSSEIYALNQNGEATLSDETAQVLAQCLEIAQSTNGAFDPTLGALSEAWGFSSDEPSVPTEDEIADALSRSGYQNVEINGNTVKLHGVNVDLGGAAKGYALERVAQKLSENGIDSALITIGGSVYSRGKKADGSDYLIGLRDPNGGESDLIATFTAPDAFVSTSGGYERGFEQDGVRYHHILDGSTGMPAESSVVSATVIGDNGLVSDALSTALFVAGAETGLAYAKAYGADALMILEDGSAVMTDGFAEKYNLEWT